MDVNVADYYDSNTKRFLKTGSGAGADAIHRPVWAPEVATRFDAVHYVDDRILSAARLARSSSFLDLGCGVGGTMAYMHARFPAEYRGITISRVQHEIGSAKLAGIDGCSISCGDMTDRQNLEELRKGLKTPVTAFCIESFLHVPEGLAFINELAHVLHPGDTLYICDDFLAVDVLSGKARRIIDDYESGWHAQSLLAPTALVHAAAGAGFELVRNSDLTPHLKLNRLTNYAIRLLVTMLRPLHLRAAWWGNFKGGDALQKALAGGLIEYRLMGFKKR